MNPMDKDPGKNEPHKTPSEEPGPQEEEELSPGEKGKKKPLFIVGMGGSAGGLEAFEEFFKNMPADTGMAFVIVQHLSPTHECLMPDLLQRFTAMKVQQIEDGMEVEPNHVYVIPPNKDLAIMHNVLQLFDPSTHRGLGMPIDFFFRHLAQDPQSARYNGMPQSAINTGLVDYTAPAYDLPDRLLKHVNQYCRIMDITLDEKKDAVAALQKIFALIRSQTGNDFSLYKKSTLLRRIERRMNLHGIPQINHYVRFLQDNPSEIEMLSKELLIGVTRFFRDPEAFAASKKDIARLIDGKKPGESVRVWVAGCSTGEEAYSIAIILKECLNEKTPKNDFDVQIYATDLDKNAIDVARRGLYPPNIPQDITPKRLERYFTKEEDGRYRVRKEIREMIVFAVQNVLTDPPFSKLDILSCRNLLIYLGPELQKKLMPLFHYTLNPGGILFLGTSESISDFTDLFEPADIKWKLFKCRETRFSRRPRVVEFPMPLMTYEPGISYPGEAKKFSEAKIVNDAQKAVVQTFMPPIVVINDLGDILYTTRKTGKYLEPSVGKVNLNIYAMAREGLRADLGTAIRKATAEKQKVVLKGLQIKTNGPDQQINLKVTPLEEPESLRGFLAVEFEDVELSPDTQRIPDEKAGVKLRALKEINKALEKELQSTNEHLQNVIEEMETSREDLKSTNEELQSTNEELQSTNEEVMTSKEELQSLTEELTTLNSELSSRNEELVIATNDMANILSSTQIPTIFVDKNLLIKRFTPHVSKFINLMLSDIGRPVTDLSSKLKYESIAEDAKEVLSSLVPKVVQVESMSGEWYRMNIVPYRTTEDIVDGIVITFPEITELKKAEGALRVSEEKYRTLFETFDEGYCLVEIILDEGGHPVDMRYLEVNSVFERQTGLHDVAGKTHADLGLKTERYWFEKYWEVARTGASTRFESYHQPTQRWYNVFVSRADGRHADRVALVFTDTTERKKAEEALMESEKRYRELFNSMTEMFQVLELVYDENGQAVDFYYRDVNPASERLSGKSRDEMVGKRARELFGVVEEYWIQALNQVNKSGKPLHIENYSKELDKYYDFNAFKVSDRANTVAIIFSDITERKRIEKELALASDCLAADLADISRLQEIGTRLVQMEDMSSLLNEILQAAIEITDADMGNIQRTNGEGDLKIVASSGFDKAFLNYFDTVHENKLAYGMAMVKGGRVIIEDITKSPAFAGKDLEACLAAGIRAVQSTPLISRSGRMLGMFFTHYRTARRPEERDLILLDLLARQAADLIERMQAEEELKESKARQEFLLKLGDALSPLSDPIEIQLTACRVLGEHIGGEPGSLRRCRGRERGHHQPRLYEGRPLNCGSPESFRLQPVHHRRLPGRGVRDHQRYVHRSPAIQRRA